jgi:hypothetical protein
MQHSQCHQISLSIGSRYALILLNQQARQPCTVQRAGTPHNLINRCAVIRTVTHLGVPQSQNTCYKHTATNTQYPGVWGVVRSLNPMGCQVAVCKASRCQSSVHCCCKHRQKQQLTSRRSSRTSNCTQAHLAQHGMAQCGMASLHTVFVEVVNTTRS